MNDKQGGAMALQKAMVSSKSNDWATPQDFFDELDEEFSFTLDPCATEDNAKCTKFYTQRENGLLQSWSGEVVFMNPPYGGQAGLWVEKAYHESLNGATVVCLIVSATDRTYWHDYIFPFAAQIRWLRGRLKFGDATETAPFASAVVIFNWDRSYDRRFVYFQKSKTARLI